MASNIDKLVDYICNQRPDYDKEMYPEQAPVIVKVQKMGKGKEYVKEVLERNIKNGTVDYKFKQLKTRDISITYNDAVYWCVDFDITEQYIWYRIAEGTKKSGGISEIMDKLFDEN